MKNHPSGLKARFFDDSRPLSFFPLPLATSFLRDFLDYSPTAVQEKPARGRRLKGSKRCRTLPIRSHPPPAGPGSRLSPSRAPSTNVISRTFYTSEARLPDAVFAYENDGCPAPPIPPPPPPPPAPHPPHPPHAHRFETGISFKLWSTKLDFILREIPASFHSLSFTSLPPARGRPSPPSSSASRQNLLAL